VAVAASLTGVAAAAMVFLALDFIHTEVDNMLLCWLQGIHLHASCCFLRVRQGTRFVAAFVLGSPVIGLQRATDQHDKG
jgi:hypothetical protein